MCLSDKICGMTELIALILHRHGLLVFIMRNNSKTIWPYPLCCIMSVLLEYMIVFATLEENFIIRSKRY